MTDNKWQTVDKATKLVTYHKHHVYVPDSDTVIHEVHGKFQVAGGNHIIAEFDSLEEAKRYVEQGFEPRTEPAQEALTRWQVDEYCHNNTSNNVYRLKD